MFLAERLLYGYMASSPHVHGLINANHQTTDPRRSNSVVENLSSLAKIFDFSMTEPHLLLARHFLADAEITFAYHLREGPVSIGTAVPRDIPHEVFRTSLSALVREIRSAP